MVLYGEAVELIIREFDAKGRGLGERVADHDREKAGAETNAGTLAGRPSALIPVPYTIPGERVRAVLPKRRRELLRFRQF